MKTITLDNDIARALDRLAAIHGGHNEALRRILSAGGVFEGDDGDCYLFNDAPTETDLAIGRRWLQQRRRRAAVNPAST